MDLADCSSQKVIMLQGGNSPFFVGEECKILRTQEYKIHSRTEQSQSARTTNRQQLKVQ